jgi:hypothetical protein
MSAPLLLADVLMDKPRQYLVDLSVHLRRLSNCLSHEFVYLITNLTRKARLDMTLDF